MKKLCILFSIVVLVFLGGQANALIIGFSISDPIGDQYGSSPDLISMDFSFDDATGDYTIILGTTAADPFIGDFRININLFNPDTGTTAQNPSYFQDTGNDFSLSASATSLVLSGTNTRLLSWDIGDQVYINNWDTASPGNPHPDNATFFRSGVRTLPLPINPFENEDYFNQVTATISSVPEPSTIILLGSGLFGLLGFRKKFKK